MKITIECECGNKHVLQAPAKRFLQFRDNLETGEFRYTASDTEIKDGKLQEFMIHCDKCKNWMALGMD